MKMFIKLFHKYLLNVYYVSNTILDNEDIAVKTNPALIEYLDDILRS